MKIVIVSDTHLLHSQLDLPSGDLLIHCGDFYNAGTTDKWLKRINLWLESQDQFTNKVYVPGNHDFPLCDWGPSVERMAYAAHCLIDREVNIQGLRIFGSPWVPGLEGWAYGTEPNDLETWNSIPPGIDILVTHCPPLQILDTTEEGLYIGCEHLRRKVLEIRPKVHCFGHAHAGFGQLIMKSIHFINASQEFDGKLRSTPVVITL
ncbi:metallophosphatase domain-containing protein [Pelagicoccus enzymogenes]|uniref:metallophosphatase domain-containing protein n=1 Tax=Pelagicoccus enzymogenes TaxID=2773457 RepID=UPI00280D259E|nr:metallophosphatase domain-containing protein [Pelagicoccus enzymogenes]MDQ8199690.1 metallophosphatase domain-containing protein [Pelagicoccus enzymogenes]